MSTQADIDHRWMTEALRCARKAGELGEVPVGAVLVSTNNEIIGRGWNQPIAASDPSAHAEIMALRVAAKSLNNYRLPETTLYVTIEPCAMCAGAMIHARIRRLVFAAPEPKAGVVLSQLQLFNHPHNNHRVEYEHGVMAEEAAELMREFFATRRAAKK